MNKCPVCNWKIELEKPPQTAYKGKVYCFCCADCKDKFEKSPENYVRKSAKAKHTAR